MPLAHPEPISPRSPLKASARSRAALGCPTLAEPVCEVPCRLLADVEITVQLRGDDTLEVRGQPKGFGGRPEEPPGGADRVALDRLGRLRASIGTISMSGASGTRSQGFDQFWTAVPPVRPDLAQARHGHLRFGDDGQRVMPILHVGRAYRQPSLPARYFARAFCGSHWAHCSPRQ